MNFEVEATVTADFPEGYEPPFDLVPMIMQAMSDAAKRVGVDGLVQNVGPRQITTREEMRDVAIAHLAAATQDATVGAFRTGDYWIIDHLKYWYPTYTLLDTNGMPIEINGGQRNGQLCLKLTLKPI